MKDDSLNDTHITRPGGYCPKCDTVYDEPHECVGKQMIKASQDEMDKAVKNYGRIDFESKLVCEIWNEAIEAAAEIADSWVMGQEIRRLKK